jgi:hypothetical protein
MGKESGQSPIDETLYLPVEQRCLHGEYREGYVRGYIDAANSLLAICEAVFKGSIGIKYLRRRFASRIEDAATMVEDAEALVRE